MQNNKKNKKRIKLKAKLKSNKISDEPNIK